jgi:tetratricopeptide (TPR) repeat protein
MMIEPFRTAFLRRSQRVFHLIFAAYILLGASSSRVLYADLIGTDGQALVRLPEHHELLTSVAARKFEEARAEINALRKASADLPQCEVMLASLCFEAGLVSDGRSILEGIAVEQPKAFDVRLALVGRAVSEQRWFEALWHIRAAKEATLSPAWSSEYRRQLAAQLLLFEGIANEARADYHDAVRAYQSSNQSTTNAAASQGLGRALLRLGEIDQAKAAFTIAQRLDAGLPAPELAIADWFQVSGDEESADIWLQSAIESAMDDNDRGRARLARARWLLDRNEPTEIAGLLAANEFATEGLETECNYLQALTARMLRDYPTAIRLLSELHQREPTSLAYGNQLALVLIEDSTENARGRALQIAELNVRNHSELAETWSTLGWIQFRLGDLERAGISLQNARRSGVISRDTAFFLAEYAALIGQRDEAANLRQQIAEARGPFFYAEHHLSEE